MPFPTGRAGAAPRPCIPSGTQGRGGRAGRRGLFRSVSDPPEAGYIIAAFTLAATSSDTQAVHTSSWFLRKYSAASRVVA